MKSNRLSDHLILITGALFMVVPIWLIFASSTHNPNTIVSEGLQWLPGDNFSAIYSEAWNKSVGFSGDVNAQTMIVNSMIMGLGFSIGKIIISMLAAYALVYFRLPYASAWFGLIFVTLLLPLEVRIIPSYEVVSQLGMLNSYTGLILPLIASATATFFFRQFFKTIPDELLEAAQLDNAGPIRFFIDILLPLSKTMMAAIFIIMFVVGWNQYLWPIMMTTDESYNTIVMGIKQVLNSINETSSPRYDYVFAMVILAMLPPVLVVVIFQRWFVKGLVESEK
ncbi:MULTISPECIES: sn-glycerol-3-phosphate ABC transporter permease UgpE [Vibrio]|uniref:sn-glycerol-3-phosphate transport system permease protein UgpE n=1 Tax=Vibrio aestuarianus TaxID=28171 RepID=A0ABD7YIE9_9VIBR|nr:MULTISPECIES: sn-glycerol-3-phosphate ABC transporter permease UgpE [Vibrio]KOE77869.1 glycerol-3-phosphate ABC transporter permease [Vibrio alginolyticus]MDE1208839.1 sn-glycerol-3-phosphate ABC transporter permease UgpE [Vibrio aestuarianus]MDE1221585.1 sn-glycerol-3-phosphate ABC transporter permease UgpE [Vibrio aestuarianus]MDE1252020.1 sn-glycerol-3-phosphate ABC transporter permease UgpE [Vibrio aestuarianus]MDE1325133.1 sn-glycerol-3-phosphate ABC transporter permease UgpE [Vibrio a